MRNMKCRKPRQSFSPEVGLMLFHEREDMNGCNSSQAMVDRTPRFEGQRSKGRRENQVVGKKSGIIRPDKRKKAKYL